MLDGRHLFSLSIQKSKCSILYLIKRILEGFNVLLMEPYKEITGSRRIRDALGSQYPQDALCFLQSLDVVDNLTASEKVVYEVLNMIGLEVRLVALQY